MMRTVVYNEALCVFIYLCYAVFVIVKGREPLIKRPLLGLYAIVFLMMLVFNSTFTLLPLYLIALGGSPFIAGLQTALFLLASILLRFYFGPLADNIGRKTPLLVGIICFTISSFLFTLTDQVWMIGLVRLIQAAGLSAFLSSSMSAAADFAPIGKIGAVMGTYRLSSTLSLLAGPALAIQVVRVANYNTWFLISGFLGVVSLLVLLTIPFTKAIKSIDAPPAMKMWHVLFQPTYRLVYFGIALTAVSYGALLSFVSLHVQAVTNIENPGIYFVFFGVASLFFTFLSGHLSDRWGRAAIAWPSIIMLGIGLGALFFLEQGQWIVLLISSWLTGIGFNGGLSVLSAWLVDITSVDQRATVLSVQESIIDFSIGLISFTFGSLSIFTDFSLAFLVTGVVIAGLGLWYSLKFYLSKQNKTSRQTH